MTTIKLDAPGAPTRFDGWATYFDEFAPVYEAAAFGRVGLAHVGNVELNAVLRALRECAPGRVLDAGAGTGRITRALTRAKWSVTALDISTEMLDQLARELPATRTVQGALGSLLPLADATFDAVVSMRVLKYVDNPGDAVSELARVLRPGGHAVIEFANARSFARWGYRGAPIRFETIQSAKEHFAAVGLHVVGQYAGTWLPYPVWSAANGARTARAVATLDRGVGRLLGGDATLCGARSFILHGLRA